MRNKIIINVYVPVLDESYEIYIPVNESIKKVLESILKLVESSSDSEFDVNEKHCLVDPETCLQYNEAMLVRDTNIRNSKLLLLI